ncbi:type II secretion system protein N [Marinobacter confluentis]|uniref:General secretion pathway protein GspC n=1 Tax=Marinobacter confluentis TaxID=1697557 RepID=A0A4Z1C998_9GAMM|nr:type II secretion system protein N [Marinobacter confluentis]TGN39896.1 general secretion pathway protein GspC [Marinobacter confluentis]
MSGLSLNSQRRLARILANVFLAILVIYSALTLARVTWMIAWTDRPVMAAPGLMGAGAQGSADRLQPMAAHAMFGRSANQAPVADVVKRSAPETRLNLALEGVMIAQRPEDSGAIVAGSNGVTEHYRVGDTLPGNAQLAEVEPNRILIRRNGQYESLSFEEKLSTDLIEDVVSSDQDSADEFISAARDQLENQGVAALAAYGLSPSGDDGSSGYVYDGSNAMLNAVSLRAGDVITAINGQRLGDFEQDKSLLENWRSESQIDIEIERDGALLSVSYAIPEQWR